MRPSYEQLLVLNPLLKRQLPDEVISLLNTIEECGYNWDPSQMMFYNSEISRGIRIQGLDLFTPETFKEHHDGIYREYAANPMQYNLHACGMYIWTRWVPRLMILFAIDLLGGWLILPTKYWLLSLGIIVILFFIMKSFLVDATLA